MDDALQFDDSPWPKVELQDCVLQINVLGGWLQISIDDSSSLIPEEQPRNPQ